MHAGTADFFDEPGLLLQANSFIIRIRHHE